MTIPLVQVGLDRGCASLADLEEAHRALGGRPSASGVSLVTCHRVELYLEGADAAEAVVAVRLFEGWLGRPVGRVPVVRRGEEAARHLLRVAAGLESAILGDDQILGQARQAYREACEAGKAGRLLHRLFHAAFRTGRRARSETPLKEGTRSIAGAAVAEIARLLGDLSRRTVTVVGAGEIASLAARLLAERQVGRLLIVNRTFARARELAEAVHGEAVPWEWRGPALGASSAAVLASRVAAPLVTAASLMALTRGRREPFVLADLGVPRNAEPPAPVPAGLRLLDVDTLARTRDEREERREGAVAAALTIVEEELSRWVEFARQPRMAENGPGSPRRAADPIRCRKTRP